MAKQKKNVYFFFLNFSLHHKRFIFYLLDAAASQAIDCDIYGGIECRTIISMVVVVEEE